jgi:c(7)-type cytochrome triheme protein
VVPRSVVLATLILLGIGFAATGLWAENWSSLEQDGLHDPSNPSLRLLQDPEQALSRLAPDGAGNKVDWVAAVRQGQIQPRTSIDGARVPEEHDSDIIMKNTLSLPAVRFPHDAHNLWMSCEMCHDKIFKAEIDSNPITMSKILDGEYCGLCHGAVSFPLTECDRCHSVLGEGQRPASRSGVELDRL